MNQGPGVVLGKEQKWESSCETRLGASEVWDDISGSVRGMYSEIHAVEINYDGGSFMSPSSEDEERSFQEIQQEIKLARILWLQVE